MINDVSVGGGRVRPVNAKGRCAAVADAGLESLYAGALTSRRTGHLYCAFPYPTKISPEAVALFIAAHTDPGDTVFDGFAGSGTTGLAALLCGDPPDELRTEAERLGLRVKWGPRNAVLYELGALGAFVARTLTDPPNPQTFRDAAETLLQEAEDGDGWAYATVDPDGRDGVIRHVVWADLLTCPVCHQRSSLWEACVSLSPAEIASSFSCPECGHEAPLGEITRVTESVRDDILGEERVLRLRRPVRVYGSTGRKRWSRDASDGDLALIGRVDREPLPDVVPKVTIPWGDLYRSGYHQGITHLHHFYTRRNLLVFARLWERASRHDGALAEALRFWLLSYNASHATIMTRVAAKSGQKNLVVTSAQPGVLYVSGLPVEKNLFAGLRRKLSTIANAFEIVHGRAGRIKVHQRSSCGVHLPDHSVDYVFTDPPFGGNIPYAEISFLNEAWLGLHTKRDEEIIVSGAQGKAVGDYQELLCRALRETRRILKPEGKATLVFHSASADIWNALRAAYSGAGFGVECASVLDKTQGSFKQVTTNGAVKGDPVLLLGKKAKKAVGETRQVRGAWTVAEQIWQQALLTPDPEERTAHRLYSRLVNHFLIRHQPVPLNAEAFYRWHRARQASEVGVGAGS